MNLYFIIIKEISYISLYIYLTVSLSIYYENNYVKNIIIILFKEK